MTQSRDSAESRAARELFLWLVTNALLLLAALFIASQWLTRLLFQHVLNPLLDGALDRHDGAVVMLSGALWSIVAGGILFPLALARGMVQDTTHLAQVWLWSWLAGFVWGLVVGTWVLFVWWSEIESRSTAGFDIVQVLDTPITLTQASPAALVEVQSDQPLRANDLERLILGQEQQEKSKP